MLPCRRELNFQVLAVLALNRAFWLNLEGLGRLLGSTWALLGPTWGQLGRSWGQLGRPRGQLGGNLGGLGAILGALWANLGVFWVTWAFQSISWAALGGFWARLGAPEDLSWRLKALSAAQIGGPKPSADPILEASSSLRCQIGGTQHLRNIIL